MNPIHQAQKKLQIPQATLDLLAVHVVVKWANHNWIVDCLEGRCIFPWQVNEKGKATLDCPGDIKRILFFPTDKNISPYPSVPLGNRSLYLLNIPFGKRPGFENYNRLTNLLELVRDEAFETTALESRANVIQRLALVIGVNQFYSIDPAINRDFIQYIYNVPLIQGISYRIFGFFWFPQLRLQDWVVQHNLVIQKKWNYKCNLLLSEVMYRPERAFLILKAISSVSANRVREALEGDSKSLNEHIISQIPFQSIRQNILSSPPSREIAHHFVQRSNAATYYGVMDADAQHLRTTTGLFSRLDAYIKEYQDPSVISLGYKVSDNELPLIKLGVKIDMKVREAMNSVIPFGAYFPEPGTFFCVRPTNGNLSLDRLSFMGDGLKLENRRLIQNGLKTGVLSKMAIFIADGGVTTSTPSRMYTMKNGTVTVLTASIIKQKKYFTALRAISQTHATPKQWADNLYIALEFSVPQVTSITQHLMHIFSVFDPISRMDAAIGRFSPKIFDKIMDEYNNGLNDGLNNTLQSARINLLQLNMPKDLIDKIEEAARRSGRAIFNELNAIRKD